MAEVGPIHGLQAQRPLQVARRLLTDWGQIITFYAVAYLADHLAVYVLAAFLIGLRQHALALLGHEGVHRLLARNRALNDLLTNALCLYPLGATVVGYRDYHMRHHRHLGREGDPELSFVAYALPVSGRQVAWRALLDLLGFGTPMLLRFVHDVRPARFAQRWWPRVWLALFIALTWYLDLVWIALIWFGAMFSSLAMAFRLRAGSEHHGLRDQTYRFEATRLSRYLYLPHNTHCHYEHHRYAAVPCYNLPALRRVLDDVPILRERDVLRALGAAAPSEVLRAQET